jgi:hypothetical protein
MIYVDESGDLASVIEKQKLRADGPDHPYKIALKFCLERAYRFLEEKAQVGVTTHIAAESRGKTEDDDLELEFRRICDGNNIINKKLPFQLTMCSKKINSTGLQLADLAARPIGIQVLKRQNSRAYQLLEPKLRRGSSNQVIGYGLKIFP